MGVCLKVPPCEGWLVFVNPVCFKWLCGFKVITCFELVIAYLEELMIPIMLPPRTVERGSIGEVTIEWVVFDSDVRYRAPTVVSWYVCTVKQEVGLDG